MIEFVRISPRGAKMIRDPFNLWRHHKMSRILLAWELGAGMGHCVKLLPIAARLIEQGHCVYFAARDVVTARRLGGDLPVEYLQAPHLAHRPANAVNETRTFSDILFNAGFGDDEQLQGLLASWRSLIALVKPAAILCEHAPTGLLASRWFDAPRFAMGTGFSLPPDVTPLPNLRQRSGVVDAALQNREAMLLNRVNRLLGSDGLEPLERLSQLYADLEARFLMTFRELDHHPVRAGEAYRGVWSLDGGALPQWPERDGPKVFAYLKYGVKPWNVERALLQLGELGVRTIAYIAGAPPDFAYSGSASLRIASRPLDIAAVGDECDVAILPGTAGATTQLLLAGVPLVLAPLYFEQAIMSLRVAQVGAGVVVDVRRPRSLLQAVENLTTFPRYQAAAESFSRNYASYDAKSEQSKILARIDQVLK